jgi:hypothetical protein
LTGTGTLSLAGFTANGGLSLTNSGMNMSGPGGSQTISVDYSVNNRGLRVDFPSPFGSTTFRW